MAPKRATSANRPSTADTTSRTARSGAAAAGAESASGATVREREKKTIIVL